MEDQTQSEPATKGDLVKLSETVTLTRGDLVKLSETVTRIAIDLSKTQADVREIKDDISTRLATKDDINRIMKALDTYTGEAISYRNRDTLRGNEVMEHTSKLKNHEDRLVLLETKK